MSTLSTLLAPTGSTTQQKLLPGLGAPGWQNDPNNPENPNSADAQARFQAAADSGYFGPTTLEQLLASDQYKAYGNNTQAYDEAYQNAINAQRANITQMFGAALADIQNRQNAGDQMIGQLPGQIKAAYAPAEQSVRDNAAAAEQAQRNSGLATFLPANAISQPSVTAMETSQAAHQADVPVLHQAMNTEFGKERTDVQTKQSSALADLAAKEADHAAAQADKASEPTWMQKLLIQNFQDTQQAKAAGNAKAAAEAQKAKTALTALQAKGGTVKPSSGKAFVTSPIVADQINAIRGGQAGRTSQAYQDAMNQIGSQFAADTRKSAKGGTVNAKQMQQIYQALIKKYPKQGSAISMALYDLGLTDKDWQSYLNS